MSGVIPFVDLKAQYRTIQPEVDAAVARVLASCEFVLGPEVAAFEAAAAEWSGAAHAVAVNSGTSALHLALLASGVGPGDEVITTPLTFIATAAAIAYAGARPVFVDVDDRSMTIDQARIEAAITPQTRAIVPVHLYGQPADMAPIRAIARARGVTVIEDAAQAHGAEYEGRRCGTLGDIACFSFYPGKNLGAYGEGGLVVTDDPQRAHIMRMLRDWGQERKYEHLRLGFNYRMDALQAAILGVKLPCLEAWTDARRARAARYDELLRDVVRIPEEMPYARHVYHVYAIRTAARDALRERLAARGIQTGIHYPIPVHLQPAFAHLDYREGAFPVAEAAAREVLSLPMYAEMPDAHQLEIAAAVAEEVHAAVC